MPRFNQGLLPIQGLIEGLSSGIKTYQSERTRQEQERERDFSRKLRAASMGFDLDETGGLIKNQNHLADKLRSSETATKILHKLYPDLQDTDFTGANDATISNVFKVKRLREGSQERKDLLREKYGIPGKKPGLLNWKPGRGGETSTARVPQEGENPNPKGIERYQKELMKYTKDLTGVAGSADTIARFADLAKSNPTTAAALPILLARAIGEKGPLSNFDVQQWGGSKAVLARLRRTAQMAAMGTLPDEDIKFIKEIGLVLSDEAKKRIRGYEDDITNKYSSNWGGEPESNYYFITGKRRTVEPQASGKIKKEYSKSRNKTRITYPDGRQEIVDGEVK